jgi:hypothetical protein
MPLTIRRLQARPSCSQAYPQALTFSQMTRSMSTIAASLHPNAKGLTHQDGSSHQLATGMLAKN